MELGALAVIVIFILFAIYQGIRNFIIWIKDAYRWINDAYNVGVTKHQLRKKIKEREYVEAMIELRNHIHESDQYSEKKAKELFGVLYTDPLKALSGFLILLGSNDQSLQKVGLVGLRDIFLSINHQISSNNYDATQVGLAWRDNISRGYILKPLLNVFGDGTGEDDLRSAFNKALIEYLRICPITGKAGFFQVFKWLIKNPNIRWRTWNIGIISSILGVVRVRKNDFSEQEFETLLKWGDQFSSHLVDSYDERVHEAGVNLKTGIVAPPTPSSYQYYSPSYQSRSYAYQAPAPAPVRPRYIGRANEILPNGYTRRDYYQQGYSDFDIDFWGLNQSGAPGPHAAGWVLMDLMDGDLDGYIDF